MLTECVGHLRLATPGVSTIAVIDHLVDHRFYMK